MSIQLYSEFLQPLPLSNEIPAGNNIPGIYKAKHGYANEKGNEFIFQELRGRGFLVRFDYFNIKEAYSFTLASDSKIFLQISMFETLQYQLAGYGTIAFHQRGYNLITVPSFSAQYKVSKRTLLIPVEISFSKDFLKPFTHYCSQLNEFLLKTEKGKAGALFNTPQIAGTEILAMIDLIVECGNDKACDPDWINVYMHELLKFALKDKPRTRKIKINQEVINKIYEVEGLLDEAEEEPKKNGNLELAASNSKNGHQVTNMGEAFEDLKVEDLAEYAGVSVYTLTKTFKEVFGYSITNYKKETKWQAILVMLARGIENMKTISHLAGYTDPPSFSRAFKKRFGNTPSEYVQEWTKKLKNYKKTANRNMQ